MEDLEKLSSDLKGLIPDEHKDSPQLDDLRENIKRLEYIINELQEYMKIENEEPLPYVLAKLQHKLKVFECIKMAKSKNLNAHENLNYLYELLAKIN